MYKTQKLVTLSILSAIGTVLMYLEIPSPITWLMFDLSDVVVYLSAMIYGPVGAILVALIKSIIHFFIKGSVTGVPINQFIAFVASLSYALPLYYLSKLFKRKTNHTYIRIAPLVISMIFATLFMTVINFWLTDFYIKLTLIKDLSEYSSVTHTDVMNVVQGYLGFSLPKWIEQSAFLPKDIWFWFIVLTYIPFNFVKLLLTSITYFVLSYRLDYILKRYQLSDLDKSMILQLNQNEQ